MIRNTITGCILIVFTVATGFFCISGVSAEERTEIRVGANLSLTGMNAMTGAEQKWAYEQAIADINKKGGVYVKDLGKKLPIRLIVGDDKSVADQGAAVMERLVKLENIDLALSGNVTPLNIAAATVADKYKVFYSIVCSWLDIVGDQHFQFASDMFFSATSASRVPFQIFASLPEAERPKRVALMMEDNPDGQGFGSGFKHWAKEYGYQFVVDEPYVPGSKDFSSHILKMKAKKADALLWLGSPTDGITLLRQIKEQQLKLRYIHGWKGFWPTEFVQAVGDDSDYIIFDGFWSEDMGAPGAKELGERYKKQFGKGSVSIGLYYANPQILAMAIEKAGSIDSEKVRDAVFGGEFKGTVMGDVRYDENGLAFVPSLALQWWKGERKLFWPLMPGRWQLKMIPEE